MRIFSHDRMLAAGLAVAAMLAPQPVLAAATVIAASGPSAKSYPAGRKIADSEKIVLRAGDTVTLIDGRGTRVVRGPGSYGANSTAGASRASTFAMLTRDRSASRVRTGAVRAGNDGGPVLSPNLWYVDVRKPGTYCLTDPSNVRLWRPDVEQAVTLTVRAANGEDARLSFAPGEMVAPWSPAMLPVADGAAYRLEGAGAPGGEVRFALIAEKPADMQDMAAALIARGCSAQLEVLTSSLALQESGS